MFKNAKPGDVNYNADWCSIFLAWCFKKAGLYNAVFDGIASANVKNLACRFMTGGSTKKQGISLAFFSPNYIKNVVPGDIVFYNWHKTENDDYSNISNINKISHAGVVTAVNDDGSLEVVEGNFKNEVWKGALSKENIRHNPNKIAGFGVYVAVPQRATDNFLPTPLLCTNKNNGKQTIIYHIYKDGNALTNAGEMPLDNFILVLPKRMLYIKTVSDIVLYNDHQLKNKAGELIKGQRYAILNEEKGVKQIVYQSSLLEDSKIFSIYKTAFINSNN
ncbi:MAG: CHAP domain-containing protein [Christensenellaceae bacterium]|nr:CHAP domain-containing protein [Christensenellaceae bacterium]